MELRTESPAEYGKNLESRPGIEAQIAQDDDHTIARALTILRDRVSRRPIIRKSSEIVEWLTLELANERTEHFGAVYLASNNGIIERRTISVGGITDCTVEPREVIRGALLCDAVRIILAHNHPSGDTEPSKPDITVTTKMFKAAELFGIVVLDHIIVGGGKSYSMSDNGDMNIGLDQGGRRR